MNHSAVDKGTEFEIMTPEEIARYLRKSISWVYKNWQLLGGRKLRGSLLFPKKEDLYERLFYKGEGVEVRLHPQRNQAYGSRVQNLNRSEASRIKKKRGGEQITTRSRKLITVRDTEPSPTRDSDPNRHGIFGTDE